MMIIMIIIIITDYYYYYYSVIIIIIIILIVIISVESFIITMFQCRFECSYRHVISIFLFELVGQRNQLRIQFFTMTQSWNKGWSAYSLIKNSVLRPKTRLAFLYFIISIIIILFSLFHFYYYYWFQVLFNL